MKGATAQFGGGAYGTISSAAIYANRYKNLGFRLSYGHDQNQQWRNGSALAYRDKKFNVQTKYVLKDDSKISLSGGLVDVRDFDGRVANSVVQTGMPVLGYPLPPMTDPISLSEPFGTVTTSMVQPRLIPCSLRSLAPLIEISTQIRCPVATHTILKLSRELK